MQFQGRGRLGVQRKESILRGAAVLAAATLAVRLLGVILWPLVTRLFAPFDGKMGEAGTGLARMPISTYQIILAFSSSGFNVAIAKLVAERLATGDAHGARRVFRASVAVMVGLGLLFTVGFWWGAPTLAGWIRQPDTAPGFRAMAPAMILMTLTAAYRGLFQGFQRHTPNGVSQVVEQLVRVGAALGLLVVFAPVSIALGAAAVNFGDVPGALAALLYLYWLYRRERRGMWRGLAAQPAAETQSETTRALLRRIFVIALPITLIGAIMPLMIQADTVMVNHLLRNAGMETRAVDAAFGQLSNANQLVWAATILSGALYTSLVPAVAEALAQRRLSAVRQTARTAYQITVITALPLAAGMWILGGPLYTLVYGGGGGGPVLAAAAWGALFLNLQQTSSGLLQGAGHVTLTVVNLLAGTAVKILMTYVLMGPLGLGVNGAAYATVAGFALVALLNAWGVQRRLGAGPDPAGTLLKPGLAAAAMVAALWGLLRVWPVPGALLTVLMVGAGAAVYGLTLLLVRGLPAAGLMALPGGGRLVAALQRFRLL